jgi:hypothetical protein
MEEQAPYKTNPLPKHLEFHECPIEGVEGGIVTEKILAGPDYLRWYKAIMTEKDPAEAVDTPSVYRTFPLIRHFIKRVDVPDYPLEMWDGDGSQLPLVITRWAVHVAGQKLQEAQDPNAFAGTSASTSGM